MSDYAALATWLRPALLWLDEPTLARCDAWVYALRTRLGGTSDLVLAAYRQFPGDLLGRLESVVHEADADYAIGQKKQLIARLSAAAVMGLIGADAEDNARTTATALYVTSAEFLEMEPLIGGLAETASECISRIGTGIRARTPAPPSPQVRRRATKAGADETMSQGDVLRAELAVQDSKIVALSKRTEDIIELHSAHLDILSEQMDVLMWAQSITSATANMPWTTMDPLDRAVVAGHELSGLLRHPPASEPIEASLARVAQSDSHIYETYDIYDIASAMVRHRPAERGLSTSTLMPLASAAYAIAATTPGGDQPDGSLLRDLLGLDVDWRKSPLEVAKQILVEQCLRLVSL